MCFEYAIAWPSNLVVIDGRISLPFLNFREFLSQLANLEFLCYPNPFIHFEKTLPIVLLNQTNTIVCSVSEKTHLIFFFLLPLIGWLIFKANFDCIVVWTQYVVSIGILFVVIVIQSFNNKSQWVVKIAYISLNS